MAETSPFLLETEIAAADLAGWKAGAVPAGLAPRLQRAAAILANPMTTLNLRLWGGVDANAETSVIFPDVIAGGGGVMLMPVSAERLLLRAFVDGDTPAMLVARMLPPGRPAPDLALQVPAAALQVLAGLIDMTLTDVRAARVAAVQAGKARPAAVLAGAAGYGAEAVAGWLSAWWGLGGFGALLTYAVALGNRPAPPDAATVAQLLEALTQAGLAVRSRQAFRLAPVLEPLAAAALGLSAGIQWQRLTRRDAETVEVSERLLLFGGGGTILEMRVPRAGMLHLGFVEREAVEQFISEECLATAAAPAPVTGPVKKFCGACGQRLAIAARFCGACGAPV